MNNDLKQSIMILAKGNTVEYESIFKMSVENFLIKYKMFIDELDTESSK